MFKRMMLVDTAPTKGRGHKTVNFGFQIVKDRCGADACTWIDTLVDIERYDTVAFNVFYAMNLLNIYPFLKKNGILPGSDLRKTIKVIAGGQGINKNGVLDSLVDEVFYGEIDAEENTDGVFSAPVFARDYAVLEIQRGCRYRCKFCQYGNDRGGRYREKPVELAKEQIDEMVQRGIHQVNFLSVNLGGYAGIGSLIEHCEKKNVRIRSADTTILDFHNLKDYMHLLPKAWRFGVETFDEATRKRIGKGFSDETLFSTLDFLLSKVNLLHIYLIYGLPGDDYSEWIRWTKVVGDLITSNTKTSMDLYGDSFISNKIRVDFSVSTFEPEEGTPYSDMSAPDFKERERFFPELISAMKSSGIIRTEKDIKYTDMMGKFGRSESSYRVLMDLKRGDAATGFGLFKKFKSGYNGSLPAKR